MRRQAEGDGKASTFSSGPTDFLSSRASLSKRLLRRGSGNSIYMTKPLLRIAHLSDLHFLDPLLEPLIREVNEALENLPFKLQLDIHSAQQHNLRALADSVKQEDPDVIIVSGDITSLGDEKSFDSAGVWLRDLAIRSGGNSREIVVVPGNHDDLAFHLKHLLTLLNGSFFKRILSAVMLGRLKRALFELQRKTNVADQASLSVFREWARSNHFHKEPQIRDLDAHSRVAICPFWSVSLEPLWVNLGTAYDSECRVFVGRLKGHNLSGSGVLRIAVLHHSPISSPDSEESNLKSAYNAMPRGSAFLRTIQESGVDLVLHGHQHLESAVKFDYQLKKAGHAYCIGAPSSTEANCGYSLIDIDDINRAKLSRLRLDKAAFVHKVTLSENLRFERNRPIDEGTIDARYEMKGYYPRATDEELRSEFAGLHETGAEYLYVSGRKLGTLLDGAGWQEIVQLLETSNTKVRFLLEGHEALRALADKTVDASQQEVLIKLADDAQAGLGKLVKAISDLSAKQKQLVEVRTASVPLAFAATVRDPNRPWGKMVVRALHVAASLPVTPWFRLNRRCDHLLFDQYREQLRQTILSARVEGQPWRYGDHDLQDA
jgi:predicted phosphodiesterase